MVLGNCWASIRNGAWSVSWRAALLSAAVLSGVAPLWGWGGMGHQIVALIAEENLKPATREKIKALLAEGATLTSISTWADEIRRDRPETGPWHFINIPVAAGKTRWETYCPPQGCVVREVENFRRILRNKKAPPEIRQEALRFLVHFVGDLHQPLHVADKGDRGGNDLKLLFPTPGGLKDTNLHAIWDTDIPRRLGEDPKALADGFLKALNQQQRRDWARGKTADWAWESHAYSARVVYPLLPPGEKPTITEQYIERAAPLARIQMTRAGLRLAALLNDNLK